MLRKKSKKGQGVVEAFSWIAMIFFTILFYILFSLGGCGKGHAQQKMFSEDLTELKINYDLAAFLRTPVEFQGAKLTVSDAIVLAMENEDMAKALVPGEGTEYYYFDMESSSINEYLVAVREYSLTYTAANVMKTYEGFPPKKNPIRDYYFCGYKLEATKNGKTLVFYDARYESTYRSLACSSGYTLAESKIPSLDGGDIFVKIKTTLNVGRAGVDVVAGIILPPTIVVPLLNIYG
ncbi:hypothetical protein JW707_03690 [Candidatus Woesearchaeota archaeon]|nr:hypothetical protein [Candidatus Woesearchaeota archaeon]